MKLSDLSPGSYEVEAHGQPDQPLKLSELHPDSYKVESLAGHREISEFSPVKEFAKAVHSALTEPYMGDKELQAKHGPVVQGEVPMVIPGGQAVASAGRFAKALIDAGEMAKGVQGATIAPRLAQAAEYLQSNPLLRTGASTVAGGVEGFAGGPTDQTLDERVANAKSGAIRGLATGAGAEALSAGAGKLGKVFAGKAEDNAFKAMGPDFRAVRQNMEKGRVRDIGRTLLDEGVIEGYAPKSKEALASRLGEFTDHKGKEINNILQELDAASQRVADSGAKAGISRSSIGKSLREELINPDTDLPGVTKDNKTINRLISDFENGGEESIGLIKGENLKRSADKRINWNRLPDADIPIAEQVARALRRKLKEGVESGAIALENAAGGPNAQRFANAKEAYGNLDEARSIAKKSAARDGANRFISPSDYMTGLAGGAVGFASGDDLGDRIKRGSIGLGLGAVNRVGRKYGNQVLAATFNGAANKMAGVSKAVDLVKNNPGATQAVMGTVLRGEPKWANDGADKVLQHDPSGTMTSDQMSQLSATPKGKRLLIQASDLKPGSPAMQKVYEQIQKELKGAR